jgi:hypothetical protein
MYNKIIRYIVQITIIEFISFIVFNLLKYFLKTFNS